MDLKQFNPETVSPVPSVSAVVYEPKYIVQFSKFLFPQDQEAERRRITNELTQKGIAFLEPYESVQIAYEPRLLTEVRNE